MSVSSYLTSLFGLEGQVAVVVGATGVLGGAIAQGLGQAGAKIVVAGRNEERGAARVAEIEKAGGQATFISVEASDRKSTEELLKQTLAKYGQVDILVNCAGSNSAVPYEQISDEQWQSVLDSQLKATHLGCQIFAPEIAKRPNGGAILNIGSVTAHLPLSRVFAYSAAKAAVVNLTQNVAREYAPKKVRVNVLCPGFFPAEQNRKILDATRVENIMHGTPMKRFGEPDELVGASILLCANKAGSFMTGATIYVDGGFTANRF